MDRRRGTGWRLAVAVGVAAAVVVLSACAGSAPAAEPDRAHSTPVTRVGRPALDAIAARYRTSCAAPGAAIGVRMHDGTTQFATAGDLAPRVPITPASQFLAGSVTKLFVAVVAYQLVADGKLSLEDSVDRYLPGWPHGDRITVAMLLGHRSGMGDFGNDFGASLRDLVLADLARVFTYREVLDLVRAVPFVAEPGTAYHYTNASYIVLGAILQRVTHESLGELMRSRVTTPLALHRTLYGPDDLRAAAKVVFHGLFDVTGSGTPIDVGGFPRAAALTSDPAGAGLFSTLPDLLRFTHAAFGGHLLAGRERAALARSVSTLTARDLLLSDRFAIHGHGGASPGAQTIVAYDREARHDGRGLVQPPRPRSERAPPLSPRRQVGLRAQRWRLTARFLEPGSTWGGRGADAILR